MPSTVISNGPLYQKLVADVPSGVFWAAVGFAAASYIWDPFQKGSRLRQLWRWMTDVFSVEHLCAQSNWSNWDSDGSPMPMSDIGVRLLIRWRRDVHDARLYLRVFSHTGAGQKPFEHVMPIGIVTAAKGEILQIPVVDIGIAEAGWDHTRRRGWGPDKGERLIAPNNVAILECQRGWLTQRHRMFVTVVSHVGKHEAPRLYVQDEADDLFDTSASAKLGIWKYG